VRRLSAIYDEVARIFHEIAQLAVDQSSAIVRNDTVRLSHLAERAETLAARFRLLESARLGLAAAGGPYAELVGGDLADGPGSEGPRALHDAKRRLTEAATDAALAASQCAEFLARTSAATAAIHRVLEGAASAGYLPNGELRGQPRSAFIERRA